MRRIVTLGLLASTMLALAMPASAQREDRGGGEAGRGGWSRGENGSGNGRGWSRGVDRSPGASAQGRPAPTVQTVPVRPSNTDRNWTDRRPTRVDQPGSSGEAAGGRWNGGDRGGNGNPRWTRPDTPAGATPQPAVRPDRGPDAQRGWQQRGNGRPDGNWNRDNNWNRGDNANRGDNWNRGDNRWTNGDRNDWNRQRSWNGQRRLQDRDRWSDMRRWDRDWRNDRRYDWRGYRGQYRATYHLPAYRAPYGWSSGYRRFSVGIFLNNVLFSSSYWLDDPYSYRLPPAYGPLRWVRYYDDALLVDTRDGYVVDVIHDVFW